MQAERNAITLDGIPQMPNELAAKFSEQERWPRGKIEFTAEESLFIDDTIKAACDEIKKRRLAIMPPGERVY